MSVLLLTLAAMAADTPVPGDPAPPLPPEVAGATVVIVNFWASWCVPCIEELPALNTLHGKLKSEGGAVLGVNEDEKHPPAVAVVEKLGLTMPIAYDPDHAIADLWVPPVVPTTFVVKPDGTIHAVYFGQLSQEKIDRIESDARAMLK